jgi:starvation-inducible outer membrane lipoprotein
MKLLLVFSLLLSGCATPPQWLANHFDQQDPCQTRAELGRPLGYTAPGWCGGSGKRQVYYDMQNRPVGFIRK